MMVVVFFLLDVEEEKIVDLQMKTVKQPDFLSEHWRNLSSKSNFAA